MALYFLRPGAARQMRRKRRNFLLGLAFVVVLIASVAAWRDLSGSPFAQTIHFYLSTEAAVAAVACGFALWSYPDYARGRDRNAYEVTPEGVRLYTGVESGELELLGINSLPPRKRRHSQFLPLAFIVDFEERPNGGIAIRGRFGHGAIIVPGSLDGLDLFRQQLLDLGIPEAHHGPLTRRAGGAVLWAATAAFVLLFIYSMAWGTNPWAVMAGGVLCSAFIAGAWWIARRLHEGRFMNAGLIFLVLAVVFLYQAGSRAWHLAHPDHVGHTAAPASPQPSSR
jgi:hypothetical protein